MLALTAAIAATLAAPSRPKLVLVISIDQFRADYVQRFAANYVPARSGRQLGGFRFLTETGAEFADAHQTHVPTATGPGHATIMTGSEPFLNGIAQNNWYDRAAKKHVYCVSDPTVATILGTTAPMSPKNLLVTTVGDEPKMATNGKSKVVGISFKDRAAILMAGHAADTVIWFDQGTGDWTSSSFYGPKLPRWVEDINAEKLPAKDLKKAWTALLPNSNYDLARLSPASKPSPNGLFEHRLSTGNESRVSYSAFASSSYGQEFVFKTVQRAIDAEALGQHATPDVLVVNLATNDYIGHAYGPNSPEVMDISIRTDRLLAGLFTSLDQKLGIDNVEIVVTADHGVAPIPEEAANIYRTGAKRVPDIRIAAEIQRALNAKYGPGECVEPKSTDDLYAYLNRDLIAKKNLREAEVQEVAAHAISSLSGITAAFTRDQLMHGALPKWDWTPLVYNGYNERLGGDLIFFFTPGFLADTGVGTGHGTPWKYDTHVPILMRGPGIIKGRYFRPVSTADIAPTLCTILGIEYPSGCIGHPLAEALSGVNVK